MRNLWIMILALVAIGAGITVKSHAETISIPLPDILTHPPESDVRGVLLSDQTLEEKRAWLGAHSPHLFHVVWALIEKVDELEGRIEACEGGRE